MKFFIALSFLLLKASCSHWPEECGITYISPDNVENTMRGSHPGERIVGGYEAVPGSRPWQAYLIWQGYAPTCGGTLISDQWILSAGHCFYEDNPLPSSWMVVLGEFDDTIEEGYEVNATIEKIIIHPQYDYLNTDYDFTLVKLSKPVNFTERIAPACLPSKTADHVTDFPPGQVCIVSGWVSTNPAGDVWGPTLKQEYAELWSYEECSGPEVYDNWITDRMICAGFHVTGEEDPERCASLGYGDSGGPLVCRDTSGFWTHIGAVSWEDFCVDLKYTPGVYASTIKMRQWIIDAVEAN